MVIFNLLLERISTAHTIEATEYIYCIYVPHTVMHIVMYISATMKSQSTHRVATAEFWRTLHQLWLVRVGGAPPTPLSLYLLSRTKLQVTLPDTLPLYRLYPHMYSVNETIYIHHRDTYLEQKQTEKIETEVRGVDRIRITKMYACCPGFSSTV